MIILGGGVDFLGLFDVILMLHGNLSVVYFKNMHEGFTVYGHRKSGIGADRHHTF